MRILILYNVANQLKKGIATDLVCEKEITIIVPLVKKLLRAKGHSVQTMETDFNLWEKLKRKKKSIDIVLNLAEAFGGSNTNETLIPEMLEALEIPFTGASAHNMHLTLDKEKTKLVLAHYGLPVPKHQIFRRPEDKLASGLKFPMIVKPIREEASIGIYQDSVVSSQEQLRAKVQTVLKNYRQPALVEKFIEGREISVGMIGNFPDFTVFPPLEFVFPEARSPLEKIRSYEYKWGGKKEQMIRAYLSRKTARKLKKYTRIAYEATECRDYARMDYRVDGTGSPYLLEVNYNPGIGPNTHGLNNTLTMMASFVEVSFEDLVERISHELTLSQRAFFWESGDKIIITPYSIPSALFETNKKALGLNNVVNVAPASGGIELCSRISGDRKLLRLIAGEIRKSPGVAVSPYAVTQDFLQLVTKLEGMGLDFVVQENPADESQWTIPYLDSKAGFRTEMLKLSFEYKEVKVPEGFIALDATEAQQMAEWFYVSDRSSVLKSNFGESGWGVKILKKEEYPSLSAFRKAVAKILKDDVIWQDTSIVVEEFVDPDIEVAGGSPSTEMLVTDQGASLLYHCGQLLNDAGAFFGVEMGKGALSDSLSRKLLVVGNIIGKRYRELGYRGYFDIDFIVSKNGEIYVAETNTRRTGGTHVHDVARHLFGEEYEKEAYLLSHDSFFYGRKRMEPRGLLEKLKDILYPINEEKIGVIITLISEWNPVLGYIVIAPNRSEGQKLQQRLLGIFGK